MASLCCSWRKTSSKAIILLSHAPKRQAEVTPSDRAYIIDGRKRERLDEPSQVQIGTLHNIVKKKEPERSFLSFRAVNCRGQADYQAGMQRHHILPRQLLKSAAFSRMFSSIGSEKLYFENFRRNGILLPCQEVMAIRMGLPMHRGPHRQYSQLVAERIGQIEAIWSHASNSDPQGAAVQAIMRVELLQRALRRYLFEGRRRGVQLSSSDSLGYGIDFTELDAMAEALFNVTKPLATTSYLPPYASQEVDTGYVPQAMPVRTRNSD